MYLQQKARWAARLPGFLHRWLDRPGLLRWASRRGNMTDAPDLGPMTVSMLRGEEGRQRAELEAMVEWVEHLPHPDVVVLSNAMLLGLVRRLREVVGAPVVVTCQGEAPFLDGLPEPWREQAWAEARARAVDVDRFVAVSRTYGATMRERLGVPAAKMATVANGIDLEGWPEPPSALAERAPRAVGFLARLCRDKGVHTMVEAFEHLRRTDGMADVRLLLVGVVLKEDKRLLAELRRRLQRAGLGDAVEVHPNVDRATKLRLLERMSVFSVPATYGESFGLYLLEAWAMGIPVVQPAHGAFPELVGETGGGVLCAVDDPAALAAEWAGLLRDPARAQALADAGRSAVRSRYSSAAMAQRFLRELEDLGAW